MGRPGNQLGRIFSDVEQDTIAALCAIGRQLAVRLDKLIEVSQEAQAAYVAGGPGVMTLTELIELLRLDLASFPRDHRQVTVGNTPTLVFENPQNRTIPVLITNQDNAQILHYGQAAVTVTNGPTIGTKESLKVNVSQSSNLYGVVDAGTIEVGVSVLDLPRLFSY